MSKIFDQAELAEEIRDRLRADAWIWLCKKYPTEKHSQGEINTIAFVSASQEIAELQQKLNELQEADEH